MADKAITAYSIASESVTYTGTINETNHTISVTLPFGSAVTALVATFTATSGATVSVGSNVQTSGTTANNFTRPVAYTVTNTDSETQDYTVTVIVSADTSVSGVTRISKVGWFSTICVSGDLDYYVTGGVDLGLGCFVPKYVIGIQVGKGFTGWYDLSTKKLKVYSASGSEATKRELVDVTFSIILMGE